MATEFGDLLERLRRVRGLSQYRLGLASNLGAEAICRLINGTRNPNERHVLHLAVALFMEPWQIEATNELMEIADQYTFPLPEDGAGE